MTLLAQLADLAEELAGEASRLKKRAAIAEAVRSVAETASLNAASLDASHDDAGLFCLYLAGQPFAEADPRKLNAGGALLTTAVKRVSGCSDAALTAAYRLYGDLGAAAAEVWGQQQSDGLSLAAVAEAFAGMAAARTTAVRSALLEGLLRRASALETKYLLKLMLGDMRIGVKQSLIEEAIAQASATEVVAVRHAVMLEADLARVVALAFTGALGAARMRLFHPLGFMLASPVDTPEDAIARLTAEGRVLALLEDKYDGMRAQLHGGDPEQPGRVAVYSRNREDITASFPEIVEAFTGLTELRGGLILDGELLAWDFVEGKALPFSLLGQRIGRKRVDNAMRRQIPVVFMAFDLLFQQGELLLSLPLQERRARLEALVARLEVVTRSPIELEPMQGGLFAADAGPPVQRLMLSPARLVESAAAIDQAYADARARANEGVMLKAAESVYQPGRRGLAWLKLKRELATLDVVITGAEFGHGRRAGLLSDYTFAVLGPAVLGPAVLGPAMCEPSPGGQPMQLLNVGKAYSGLTDAEIAELTAWMKAHTLEDHGHFRTVEPLRVLEVAFNNVMRSDRHASGFALRFPRILRIREDKPVEEIDTLQRVAEIYESQPDKGREE